MSEGESSSSSSNWMNPVIFSRQKTNHGFKKDQAKKDNEPSAAALSIMTQTDANGQAIVHADQSNEDEGQAPWYSWIFCCVRTNTTDEDEKNRSPQKYDGDTVPLTGSEGQGVPPNGAAGMRCLLPPQLRADVGKKCLVLDLDETLVHSSFREMPNADYIIPVEIDGNIHRVYVGKRPLVDQFLRRMGLVYEVVIFTASLAKYADPLLELLDPGHICRARLFREACTQHRGSYVKDLSTLNRNLNDVIIVDNSPNSYLFHPENAIGCTSFIDDPKDTELERIGAFLEKLAGVEDVREHLSYYKAWSITDECNKMTKKWRKERRQMEAAGAANATATTVVEAKPVSN